MRSTERSRIGHLRAHAERDDRGVVADHATADHEHSRRGDARDASEEDPAAALRLLELICAGLRGEPAGDLAHRREQRQCARVGLDRLVGDRGDPGVDERARERLVRGDVEVREERHALAQPRVLRCDRLLDLEQEIGARPDVVHRRDRRPGTFVRVVEERAPDACARLHEDLVPALDELARTGGCQRDPVLLLLDLLRDADPHARGTISGHERARRAT